MLKLSKSLLLIGSLLTLPLCSLYAQSATDQEELKYYDVEIVVFKNTKVPRSHEYNFPTPSASRTLNTLDLSDPKSIKDASQSGFTPLTTSELRLQDSVDKILRSSRYSLLTHTAWRQPGLEESESIPVWVKGGRVFDSSYSSIDQFSPSMESEIKQSKKSFNAATSGLYELEGKITIILSRYLHTKAELVLRKPADTSSILQQTDNVTTGDSLDLLSLEGQLLLNYELNERRRMRSKKLHYLDHPEFGMLVLITPYEAPEPEITDQETAPSEPESAPTQS